MQFNLVIMVCGMLVGYFSQNMWVFIGAIGMFVYRYMEAEYFKVNYTLFAGRRWSESKWTSFTTFLFFAWMAYLFWLTIDLLFLKGQ